ncbi:xylose isomerase-like TIM barrel protein [Paenibacillus cellulosilyticus]|uniref:Xylose isomerase-like TIM barrel protein n=1 Tax=Paenibacillus cellulosilyticus TaxID=375489 RepID=A0A2V2YMH0_9BACL|nr:TIM barrel protein [Paenibacillus cellulosilyticus]PWV94416.1 xylose isomerase-like TIM barrel protein [Paenibacillus cellulosilyticus]QKS43909.1 sugar phosphate isomerase/epimerase [Paenibacillus cellulosilyticus]
MGKDKGIYSFSTCWNIKKHNVGSSMIQEIKDLGFRYVELNYNVNDELLSTIEPMIERGEIGVSSVHNTFPHDPDPDYGTDSVLLGFDDEEKRQRSIELLLRSAEYAYRYGAKAVVVHPSEVPFDYNIDQALKGIYHEQGKDSDAYRQLWSEMIERRESLSGHYLQRVGDSLEEVCDRIAAKGWDVSIGIETRSRCYQMPTLREARTIFDRLPDAPVGLWYDFGHGMMMERMGLYDNAADMALIKDRVVGIHIHETVGLSDHWCPYVHSGDNEYFDRFLPIIAAAPVKVYELKAACTAEEIEESHDKLLYKLATLKV